MLNLSSKPTSKDTFNKSPERSGLLFFLSFFIGLCITISSGCQWRNHELSKKTVVKVGDDELSAKDFAMRLSRRIKNFDALSVKDPQNLEKGKDSVVSSFILESLVRKYAKNNGLSVSDEELEKEVNSFRSSYPDDISFRKSLAEENLSFAHWKEELRQTLLSKKVVSKINGKIPKPTENEIQSYYNENKEKFRRKERVYLRQIVVDDLSKAQTLKEELKKKDFIALAKKYSVAPEGKNGGLVGWIEKGSVDIFDKAFGMAPGSTGPVLESPYGFHIFKVERKAAAGFAAIEEVRDIITAAILGKREQAEFSSWLDTQIRSTKVFKDADLIKSISVETRGQ